MINEDLYNIRLRNKKSKPAGRLHVLGLNVSIIFGHWGNRSSVRPNIWRMRRQMTPYTIIVSHAALCGSRGLATTVARVTNDGGRRTMSSACVFARSTSASRFFVRHSTERVRASTVHADAPGARFSDERR